MKDPPPISWRSIDRSLCEVYHLTPQAIDKLTLPEITVLLEDAKKSMEHDELIAEKLRWDRLTARQKIDEMKRR